MIFPSCFASWPFSVDIVPMLRVQISQLPPGPAQIHFRSSPIRNPYRHRRLGRDYKSSRPKDVISQMRSERKCVGHPVPPVSATNNQRPTNKLAPALRLYPSVPINVRIARKTSHLPRGGGPNGQDPVLVPRNVGVGIVPYYLHRRKDLYGPDAHDFRPERWQGPELSNIGWGYMPFHGGPRLCLGSEFSFQALPSRINSIRPKNLINQTKPIIRGFRINGSVMRRREDNPAIPKHPVAAKPSGRTDGAGEADADNLPLQHGRVQGPIRIE